MKLACSEDRERRMAAAQSYPSGICVHFAGGIEEGEIVEARKSTWRLFWQSWLEILRTWTSYDSISENEKRIDLRNIGKVESIVFWLTNFIWGIKTNSRTVLRYCVLRILRSFNESWCILVSEYFCLGILIKCWLDKGMLINGYRYLCMLYCVSSQFHFFPLSQQ